MGKTLVLGDIHGRVVELLEVLLLCKFNDRYDKLILLGDVCDGGPDTKKVVRVLMGLSNVVFVMGNHDKWFLDYMKGEDPRYVWKSQGGCATLESYGGSPVDFDDKLFGDWNVNIPRGHREFFEKAVPYYIEDNMLFVHGGYDWSKKIEEQRPNDLMWDRQLYYEMQSRFIFTEPYKKVFIGHTATGDKFPLNCGTVWAVDTGSGHKGKLTIMDIHTNEYWQSSITEAAK